MCGICGIVDFAGPPPPDSLLRSMAQTLHHRGPDDQGVAALGPAGLAQTRLSIIDLTPTGHQPMQTDDGRYTLVYNGELYNFHEIRRTLESDGIRFRGTSDSEVVLQSFARWGTESFAKFNGMFAITIWDARTERLHLARDRFGIKPLYLQRLPAGLVFGSEIKAVLACGRLSPRISWPALHEFIYYGNALGSHTLFDGVERLPPAHHCVVDRMGTTIQAYWSAEQLRPCGDDLETATASVRDRLDAAVKRHLISDVPVGVFLSGGVDSSAIVAFASRHYQGRLNTYSVAFDFDKDHDELPKAGVVARHFKTNHHELHVPPHDMQQVIEALVRAHDEPFADPADIPLYLMCEQLKGAVKVILQGDGGDEIFAGYRRYNVLSYERFWLSISRPAVVTGAILPRGPRWQRTMRFFRTMSISDPALRMAMLMTVESPDAPPTRVFSTTALAAVGRHDPFERYRRLHKRFAGLDVVQRMLYIDSMVLLPDTFLEKVDKSTMAHSIEVRVPMLDGELTEYAMSLPSKLKVQNGQKKFILRRALRGILPDAILDGKKTGLGVPVGYWLRGPLAEYMKSVLLDPETLRLGILDRAAVQARIDEHISGRRNNWFILYKLLTLTLWLKFYSVRT